MGSAQPGRHLGDVAPGEPDWQDYAACLGSDPDSFFPERGDRTTEAKAVCAGCVVREACLEYALTHRIDHGIWGGTVERDRRRIRRQRAQAARRG